MKNVLQVENCSSIAEEIIPQKTSYHTSPQLLRDRIIDKAIAPFRCTREEINRACGQFYQRCHLTSQTQQQAWLARCGMTPEDLEILRARRLKIEKFKQATWEHEIHCYFLKRKPLLAQVIYSLIRTKEKDLSQEFYSCLCEQKKSFGELAAEYSQGSEAQTGGVIGPVELATLHPHLASLLSISQPGQLWSPRPLGEWLAIVRLEKLIPAQLNELMCQRLLRELFDAWLQEQINQLPEAEVIYMDYPTDLKVDAVNQLQR